MVKPILGLAILATALTGGFFVGALGAFLDDTTADWDDE